MKSNFWLVEPRLGAQIEQASKLLASTPPLEVVELRERMEAAEKQTAAEGSRLVSRNGSTATIRIRGALMPGASLIAYLIGMSVTRYGDIIAALAECRDDASVKRVVLDIDSGGGSIDGFFEAIEAVRAFPKPMSVSSPFACSAAYGLAAATGGEIEATSRDSEFGSVGVAVTYIVWDDEVDITSTEAPKKRPNLRTEEGQAVVRERLDGYHELFVEAIAEGRNRTVDDVNANFGRGAVLMAEAAKAAGLIDKVPAKAKRAGGAKAGDEGAPTPAASAAAPAPGAVIADTAGPTDEQDDPQADAARGDEDQQPPSAATNHRNTTMTEAELREQHPALYAAITEQAREAGATAERDRVEGHLTMGEASGDMQTATGAIRSGAAMTQALQAKYLAASMNRADQTARQTETEEAAAAVDGAEQIIEEEASEDLGDKVVAILEKKLGKNAKAS